MRDKDVQAPLSLRISIRRFKLVCGGGEGLGVDLL